MTHRSLNRMYDAVFL